MHEAEAIQQFREAIRTAGLEPPEVIEPGKLHRFSTNGKSSDDAGWCLLFPDLLGGVFGDHRSGLYETWQANRDKPFTRAEREAFKRQREQAKQERQAEQDRQHAEAAKRAKSILDAAQDDPDEHPYICHKRIGSISVGAHVKCGAWPQRRWRDALLLPLMDARGEVWSIEAINVDGEKDFLAGGRTRGLFYPFGDIHGASTALIGEGFATVAPCVEVMQCAGCAAMYCDNLEPVARVVREIAPQAKIIVLADNDIKPDGSNPGLEAATHAAKSIGGKVAVPELDGNPCDFCDVWDAPGAGKQAIRDAINAARAPVETDEECFERLAKLSRVEYDRVREAEADRLGIRVKTLDSEVEKRRPKSESDEDDTQGSEILFPEPKPWPKSVHGAALLDELAEIYSRYLVLPPHAANVLASWTFHTHVFDAFEHTPRLAIQGPTKQCGKTLLLDVLQTMVPKALRTENVTPAVLFRLIEAQTPTLLIDEYDSFLRDNQELRGALNAGHKRGGQHLRCEGDQNKVRAFKTFAPVALAGIGALPDTLTDRSIIIRMQRAKPGEIRQRFNSRRTVREQELKRKLIRLAQDNYQQLEAADPEMSGFYNRQADNWRPSFAIAELVGGEWPKRVKEAATGLTNTSDESESAGVMLLADICEIFCNTRREKLPSTWLVDRLNKTEERPWSEYRRGEGINARQLAKLLRPFGIISGPRREGDDVFRGYELEQFISVFTRYLPAESVTTLQAAFQSHFSENSSVTDDESVTDRKSSKSAPHKGCNVVTDRKGGNGQERHYVDIFCQGCNGTCHAPLTAWMNPTFEIIRYDLNGRDRGYV